MTYVVESTKEITLSIADILTGERRDRGQCAAKYAIQTSIPEAKNIMVSRKGITWKACGRRYCAPIDDNPEIRMLASIFDRDGKIAAAKAFFPEAGSDYADLTIILRGIKSEAITPRTEEQKTKDRAQSLERKKERAMGVRSKCSPGSSKRGMYRW